MTTNWTKEHLYTLGRAGEIDITPQRGDGTAGSSATIWIVRVGDHLYIRSYRGTEGGWYRGARRAGRARVGVGAAGYDIVFEPAPDVDRARVDAAYRAKYATRPTSTPWPPTQSRPRRSGSWLHPIRRTTDD